MVVDLAICHTNLPLQIRRATAFVHIAEAEAGNVLTPSVMRIFRRLSKRKCFKVEFSNEYFARLYCVVEVGGATVDKEDDTNAVVVGSQQDNLLVMSFSMMWRANKPLADFLLGMIPFFKDSSIAKASLCDFLLNYQ